MSFIQWCCERGAKSHRKRTKKPWRKRQSRSWRYSFHKYFTTFFYLFLFFNYFTLSLFFYTFFTHDIYPHPHPRPTTSTHYPRPTTFSYTRKLLAEVTALAHFLGVHPQANGTGKLTNQSALYFCYWYNVILSQLQSSQCVTRPYNFFKL